MQCVGGSDHSPPQSSELPGYFTETKLVSYTLIYYRYREVLILILPQYVVNRNW